MSGGCRPLARARWATLDRARLPRFGTCLYIAVGARDELAIQRYVGWIAQVLAAGSPPRALLIEASVPGDPLSLSTLTEYWTVDGNTFTRSFDRSRMTS